MTKKLFIAALALFVSLGASAQGIDFRQVPLNEALEMGAAENKPVFLDCYTEWCGPCKFMASEVFTLKEAGDYFNPRFVNIKINMEKGEGLDIAKKYQIRAYPTFLVLNSDGTVRHRIVGGGQIDDFIKKVELGMDSKDSPSSLAARYDQGKLSKDEMLKYWSILQAGGDREKAGEIGNGLYADLSKKDKTKQAFWPLVASRANSIDSEGMEFVLANRKALDKNVGKEEVDKVVYNAFLNAIYPLTTNRVAPGAHDALPRIVSKLRATDVPLKEGLLVMTELAGAREQNDTDAFIDILQNNFTELDDNGQVSMVGSAAGMLMNGTKEQYKKMVALIGDIAGATDDDQLRDYLESNSAHFTRLANTGVYWEQFDKLEDALAQAAKENRLVFLDCYTEWCGPCKYMTNNVFTQEKVGDWFNRRFVNVKLDMEKGEGPEVARKYEVRAFPTFLVLRPDGQVLHTVVGGGDGDEFIARIGEAFDENKASGVLQAKYDAGERGQEFMLGYVKSLQNGMSRKTPQVAAEVFGTLTEEQKTSPDYWFLYEDADIAAPGSEIETYLLANLPRFRETIGREKVDERIGEKYYNTMMSIMTGRDSRTTADDLTRMTGEIKSLGLENGPLLIAYANIAKLIVNKDYTVAKYKKEAKGIKPEEVPFPYLYPRIKGNLTPSQLNGWKAWGEEIASSLSDERHRQGYRNMISQ